MNNKDLNLIFEPAKPKKPSGKSFQDTLRNKKMTKSATNLVPKHKDNYDEHIMPLFNDNQNKLDEALKQTKIE